MRSTATTRILLLFTITALVTVAPCTANDAIHNIFMAAAQECEWLRDAAISSVLMTEASHENLALAIFCDPHDLDFGGDRKIVSLAVTASDGQTRTLNISSNVDERYSRFATEKCWLAGKPVIVLTGWYWTSHLSPTVYMIDETGVFFKVSGGDFVIENGKVINFAFSDVWAEQGALPFVVDDDLDMAYCNYQSMYSIAPHVPRNLCIRRSSRRVHPDTRNACNSICCYRCLSSSAPSRQLRCGLTVSLRRLADIEESDDWTCA